MAASRPRHRAIHLFETDGVPHLFVADRSRLYDLEEVTRGLVDEALADGDHQTVDQLLRRLGLAMTPAIDPATPLDPPPVRALSLNVAQACNLACTYCYASGGDFGMSPTTMEKGVAVAAVERLLGDATPGEHVTVAFLGGEPMINRRLIRQVVEEAERLAAPRDVRVSFSITTNGTLVEPADAVFFADHRFTVTVSMDGVGRTHDLLRPNRRGLGSFDEITSRLGPLLAQRDRLSLSARVTVTALNLDLVETLEGLAALGFPSVGFSPMLASPNGAFGLRTSDVERLLAEMIACGRHFEEAALQGRRHAFANMSTALAEIHRGLHRPYPCGAGAGYLGVSATGELSACHRFVGDERGAMGDLESGPDDAARARWLESRHVDRQLPCSGCWARYLCGGGCHQEVINRGRPICDFIRGWLHYCLGTYVRLSGAGALPWT